MVSERVSQPIFFGTSALLFIGSASLTLAMCSSMSAMGSMPMPGGWAMSMMWMRMPGQAWLDAAASFVGMWLVMMVAMMLPSFLPMLSRYRRVLGSAGERRLGWLTFMVGLGYFFIWTLLGIAIYLLGVVLAGLELQLAALARMVPIAVAVILLLAGAIQFTGWKAHYLACCREGSISGIALPANSRSALRTGLRFGIHCSYSCLNLTAILLVIGVMDLRVMVVVTIAITAERLAPAGEQLARIIGAVTLGVGLSMILRVAILG